MSQYTQRRVTKKPCLLNCNSVHLNFHNCVRECCAQTNGLSRVNVLLLSTEFSKKYATEDLAKEATTHHTNNCNHAKMGKIVQHCKNYNIEPDECEI